MADKREERFLAERRREMMAIAEPFVFAAFYAATTANGRTGAKQQAESMMTAWRDRFPVPEPEED